MQLLLGDCLEKLKEMPKNSVDAVVTDPPYGLSFMGKKWDYDVPTTELWAECLRVLKPGGYLLAFAGTRTQHRMAVRIEDAGFEIRDMIAWVYGNGFPKSLNIGKAVDKLQGNERDVVGTSRAGSKERDGYKGDMAIMPFETETIDLDITKGTSEWEGWGTALKPALEPITVARKPLSEKTVAKNCLRWGVGGINIDGSRVGTETINIHNAPKGTFAGGEPDRGSDTESYRNSVGRFPANLIHDGSDEVVDLFPNSKAGKNIEKKGTGGIWRKSSGLPCGEQYGDSGSASRFFYCAKSPRSERLLDGFYCGTIDVCKDQEENTAQVVSLVRAMLDLVPKSSSIGGYGGNKTEAYPMECLSTIKTTIKKITELKTWNSLMLSPTNDFIQDVFLNQMDGTSPAEYVRNSKELMTKIGIFQERVGSATEDVKNATLESLLKLSEQNAWKDATSHHPTHKPITLMEYLVKLVSREGATILDPFMGSGTTGIACKKLNRNFIGIEKDAEYFTIATKRINNI
jgi:hypothetical protein